MQLDLQIFANAVARLEEGVVNYAKDKSNSFSRDAVIQRYEFTYELACKTMRRYLAARADAPTEFHKAEFSTVIRAACDQNLLLGEWADWKKYRDLRGKASHAYDETLALEVVADIPKFLTEAQYLLKKLRERAAEDVND